MTAQHREGSGRWVIRRAVDGVGAVQNAPVKKFRGSFAENRKPEDSLQPYGRVCPTKRRSWRVSWEDPQVKHSSKDTQPPGRHPVHTRLRVVHL